MTNRSDGHHSHDHSTGIQYASVRVTSITPIHLSHDIQSIDRYYILPSSGSFSDAATPPRVLITFLLMGAITVVSLCFDSWFGHPRLCQSARERLSSAQLPPFDQKASLYQEDHWRWSILQGDWPRTLRDWTQIQPGNHGNRGMHESSLLD